MSVSGKVEIFGVRAGADLSALQFKAMTVAGTLAGTSLAAFGILQNKPASGEDASIAYAGPMKALAGAAITGGAGLAVNSDGYIVTQPIVANSGTGIVTGSVGKAIDTAASGDMFAFLGNFVNATNVASL